MSEKRELNEEKLENVTGGASESGLSSCVCPSCGHKWEASSVPTACPVCGKPYWPDADLPTPTCFM